MPLLGTLLESISELFFYPPLSKLSSHLPFLARYIQCLVCSRTYLYFAFCFICNTFMFLSSKLVGIFACKSSNNCSLFSRRSSFDLKLLKVLLKVCQFLYGFDGFFNYFKNCFSFFFIRMFSSNFLISKSFDSESFLLFIVL